jgi:hypothetical protein
MILFPNVWEQQNIAVMVLSEDHHSRGDLILQKTKS